MIFDARQREAQGGGGFARPLLGGPVMTQRVLLPQSAEVGEGSKQLQRLLDDALDLVDRLKLPPEIGARLQELIDLAATAFENDRD